MEHLGHYWEPVRQGHCIPHLVSKGGGGGALGWLHVAHPTPPPPSPPPPRSDSRGASQAELEGSRLALARGPERRAPAGALMLEGAIHTRTGGGPPISQLRWLLGQKLSLWIPATHTPVSVGGREPHADAPTQEER